MIFEIADGEQRRNSATADGWCPILTAFDTNARRTAVTSRTCVGERSISNGRFAFTPLASRSNSDMIPHSHHSQVSRFTKSVRQTERADISAGEECPDDVSPCDRQIEMRWVRLVVVNRDAQRARAA